MDWKAELVKRGKSLAWQVLWFGTPLVIADLTELLPLLPLPAYAIVFLGALLNQGSKALRNYRLRDAV